MDPEPARQPALGVQLLAMRMAEPSSAPDPSLPLPAPPLSFLSLHPPTQPPQGQVKPAVSAGGPWHPTSPPLFLSPGLWDRFLEPLPPTSQAQSSAGWPVRSSGELLAWCSSAEGEAAVRGEPGWTSQTPTTGSVFTPVIQSDCRAPERREKREEPPPPSPHPVPPFGLAAATGWKEH